MRGRADESLSPAEDDLSPSSREMSPLSAGKAGSHRSPGQLNLRITIIVPHISGALPEALILSFI